MAAANFIVNINFDFWDTKVCVHFYFYYVYLNKTISDFIKINTVGYGRSS